MSTRETTKTLKSAMTSTDTMASDADDHVDPHSKANCTIDLVSSSMKPAPRKKKCSDRTKPGARVRLKPDTTTEEEAARAAGSTTSAPTVRSVRLKPDRTAMIAIADIA